MQIQKNINKSDSKSSATVKKGLGRPNVNPLTKKKKAEDEDDVDFASYDDNDADDVFDADGEILEVEDNIDSTAVNNNKVLGKFSLNQIIIAIVVVVLVFGFVSLTSDNKKDSSGDSNTAVTEELPEDTDTDTEQNPDNTNEDTETDSETDVNPDSNTEVEEPAYSVDLESANAINPGWYANDNTTSATVYSSTDTLKDLNGVDIPAVFTVKDIATVTEYVNYEKRRAVMDEGLELYWVEIVYSNKKYRTTISFDIFRQLNNSGICKVEMEVLTLEGGEKVISYMDVVL